MRVYEEYNSPADKRKAQVGAKRGVATGKARGYVVVFDEDGRHWSGNTMVYSSALGELMEHDQQAGAEPDTITSCNPSDDYLRVRCRKVGFNTLPDVWKQAFANKLADMLAGPWPDDLKEEYTKQRRRYRQILRHARTKAVA